MNAGLTNTCDRTPVSVKILQNIYSTQYSGVCTGITVGVSKKTAYLAWIAGKTA